MDYSYIFSGLCLLVGYTAFSAIQRLYLSPLAKFPGPKLAALTFWYEFYFDVLLGGKYTFQIGRLHEIYGTLQAFLFSASLNFAQAPPSGSIPTNCISTSPTFTKCCIQGHPAAVTSGSGLPISSATQDPCSPPPLMITIVCGGVH